MAQVAIDNNPALVPEMSDIISGVTAGGAGGTVPPLTAPSGKIDATYREKRGVVKKRKRRGRGRKEGEKGKKGGKEGEKKEEGKKRRKEGKKRRKERERREGTRKREKKRRRREGKRKRIFFFEKIPPSQ